MNLSRKQKLICTVFITTAFLVTLTGSSVSAPWGKKKEKKKEPAPATSTERSTEALGNRISHVDAKDPESRGEASVLHSRA